MEPRGVGALLVLMDEKADVPDPPSAAGPTERSLVASASTGAASLFCADSTSLTQIGIEIRDCACCESHDDGHGTMDDLATSTSIAGKLEGMVSMSFDEHDDGTGKLDEDKFRRALSWLGLPDDESTVRSLFGKYDRDNNGSITRDEWANAEGELQKLSKLAHALKRSKQVNRFTLPAKTWQKYPPGGVSLSAASKKQGFKVMRRFVMFVLPLLCSGAIVYGLVTSRRNFSEQSHDVPMLPSFDEKRFHVPNMTNLGRFEMFYFRVTGAGGCPLQMPDLKDAAFFWGSGEIWLGVSPATFTALSLNLFWPKVGTTTIATSIPCDICQHVASENTTRPENTTGGTRMRSRQACPENTTCTACLERILGDVIDQEFDGQDDLGPPTHIWGFISSHEKGGRLLPEVHELRKKQGGVKAHAYSVTRSDVWADFMPAICWSLGVGLISLLAIESVRFKCGKRLKRVSPDDGMGWIMLKNVFGVDFDEDRFVWMIFVRDPMRVLFAVCVIGTAMIIYHCVAHETSDPDLYQPELGSVLLFVADLWAVVLVAIAIFKAGMNTFTKDIRPRLLTAFVQDGAWRYSQRYFHCYQQTYETMLDQGGLDSETTARYKAAGPVDKIVQDRFMQEWLLAARPHQHNQNAPLSNGADPSSLLPSCSLRGCAPFLFYLYAWVLLPFVQADYDDDSGTGTLGGGSGSAESFRRKEKNKREEKSMSLIWVSTLHTTFWQCLLLLIIAAPAYAISELLQHDRTIYGAGGKEQAFIITWMIEAYLALAIVFVVVGYCHIFAFSFAIITRPDWVTRKFDKDRDGNVSASELWAFVTKLFRSNKDEESEEGAKSSYEDGSKLEAPKTLDEFFRRFWDPKNALVQGARIGVAKEPDRFENGVQITDRFEKGMHIIAKFLDSRSYEARSQLFPTRRSSYLVHSLSLSRKQFFVIKDVVIDSEAGWPIGTDLESVIEHDVIYKCCWAGDAELDDPCFQFKRTSEGKFEVLDSWKKWSQADALLLENPHAILRAGTIVNRKNHEDHAPGVRYLQKHEKGFLVEFVSEAEADKARAEAEKERTRVEAQEVKVRGAAKRPVRTQRVVERVLRKDLRGNEKHAVLLAGGEEGLRWPYLRKTIGVYVRLRARHTAISATHTLRLTRRLSCSARQLW